MRRRAVSTIRTVIGVVALLIVLGAGVFVALLSVPAFNNEMAQYTGVNFANEYNSLITQIRNTINNINVSKPAGITVLTNNTKLAQSIYFGNPVPSSVPFYYIEPNRTYVFNVTIVPANADGQPLLNDHMNVSLGLVNDIGEVNGSFRALGSNILWAVWGNKTNGKVFDFTTLNGTTPIQAQIVVNIPYPNTQDALMIYSSSINNKPVSVSNFEPVWILVATNSST